MHPRNAIVLSAKRLVQDSNRFARGECDERSFEDRINQVASDIGKYRGENYHEAVRILSGIVAAYDAGGEDGPAAPDVTDALMEDARRLLAGSRD